MSGILANLWYTCCFALTLAGWVAIFMRFLQTREGRTGWFLALFSAFALASLSISLGAAQLDLGELPPMINVPLNIISLLMVPVCLLTLPRFVATLLVHRGQALLIRVSTGLAITSLSLFLGIIFPGNASLFWGLFVPHVAALSLVVAYAMVAFRLIDRRHRRGRTILGDPWSHFIGPAFWLTVVAFPLSLASDLLQLPRLLTGRDWPRFIPALAAALSVAFLQATVRRPARLPSEPRIDSQGLDGFELSPREKEVAALLLTGLSYQTIGERLFISAGTVKTHVLKIYQKTGVNSKIALLHLVQARQAPPEGSTKG